jgi:thiamine phosphate synthase YjbQ (UPF0047 family)
MERLYCPDFSCVFGPKFADPFLLPNIDTQIWPIFVNFDFPQSLRNLLALESNGKKQFYHRNITLDQLEVELRSSSINFILLQAIEINSKLAIPNEFTLNIAQNWKKCRVFCSIYPEQDGVNTIQDLFKKYKKVIAGIVIYPKYNFDFIYSDDFQLFLEWVTKNKLILKFDFTDLHLEDVEFREIGILEVTSKVLNSFSSIPLVITPGEWNSTKYLIDRYKYQRNIYLELNLRTLGGQTPTQFFNHIFDISGFVQNWWSRILLASGSPTLETSQLVSAWYEATEKLNFKFKNLLRIWGFRNLSRLIPELFNNGKSTSLFDYKLNSEFENQSVLHLGYNILIQSFAITQLVSIQDVIDRIISEVQNRYPMVKSGVITIKSYHTTSSLIINEHEIGNYLDLHYYFVEESRKDSSRCLHTVAANENRADFNFPDHLLASTHGQRSITYHIRDGKLARGSRENVYALVTFGPRKINVGVDILLHKNS